MLLEVSKEWNVIPIVFLIFKAMTWMINRRKQCWQLKLSSFLQKAASTLQMFPYVKQHVQEVICPVSFSFPHILTLEASFPVYQLKKISENYFCTVSIRSCWRYWNNIKHAIMCMCAHYCVHDWCMLIKCPFFPFYMTSYFDKLNNIVTHEIWFFLS